MRILSTTITCLFYILFSFFPYKLSSQTKLIELQDRLVGLTSDTSIRKDIDTGEVRTIDRFWEIFKKIRDKEIEQQKLKGSFNFGFTGNTSNSSEIYSIQGGASLTKGAYPQEFEFSTLVNIQIANGKLQENISNLRITYDRFFSKPKDKFLLEGFGFLNRRSNLFLGVNQRYEIGGGFTLAHWLKKRKKSSYKDYEVFSRKKLKFQFLKNGISECTPDGCKRPIKLPKKSKIEPNDTITLYTAQTNIANSIIKSNSHFRYGCLFGVFYELESITHSDSINNNFFEHDFEPTSKFRWEVRPTLDFIFLEKLVFKMRPYFKFPMPWEWKVNIEGKEKVDLRIDFPVTLSMKLSDNFVFGLNYIFSYDNAPNSLVVDMRDNNELLYLTANKSHHYVMFSIGYKL